MNKRKFLGSDDAYLALTNPLSGTITGAMCKLSRVSTDDGEIPKDCSDAAFMAVHAAGPSSFMENRKPVTLTTIPSQVHVPQLLAK